MKPIDAGPGYDRLGAAMEAEAVFQIRWHKKLRQFTVELENGNIGGGNTPREAIADAENWGAAA